MSAAAGRSDELAALWDARYGASERLWSGRVNPVLVAEAARLVPGRAIDRARTESERLGLADAASFAQRDALYRGLAAAVRPGGILLLVLHEARDLELGIRRPPAETMLDADALRAHADGFASVHVELRPRAAVDRAGRPTTAHDLVLRAIR